MHKIEVNNKILEIPKGEIKIINPYQMHRADGSLAWEYINFMPSIKTINEYASDLCENLINCDITFKNQIKDATATRYFCALYNSLENELEYESNMVLLISYLIKNYASSTIKEQPKSSTIKEAIEYIHQNFNENISLEKLAKVSKLSKYHFLKCFKEKTGLTPHRYIINLRLEFAVSLIKQNLPLSQIAYRCGFSDQSHFIKTFKKVYGLTPSLLS